MDDAKKKLLAQVAKNFTYHRPHAGQSEKFGAIRAKAKELAELLANVCPLSRELAVAISNLENTVMWANEAIARNEPPKAEDPT